MCTCVHTVHIQCSLCTCTYVDTYVVLYRLSGSKVELYSECVVTNILKLSSTQCMQCMYCTCTIVHVGQVVVSGVAAAVPAYMEQ